MNISRPSPALVLSIVAIVVACAGTATAAGVLIQNSSQVKSGSINGSDIKNGSITGIDIATGAISTRQLKKSVGVSGQSVTPAAATGATAVEASRRSGPTNLSPGNHDIATLSQLPPGVYAIFAKTTITPEVGNTGLGELLRQVKTVSAQCVLGAGGDEDHANQVVASPYSQAPSTLNMQLTRSLDKPTDVKVSCTVNDYPWNAADTSIIAVKLSSSTRTDVTQ